MSTARSAGAAPNAHPTTRVEVVTTLDGLRRLEAEWTALSARVPDATPFTTHEWAVAWWTHLRRATRWKRDALRVFVVRSADGAAIAFAPYMLTEYRALAVPVMRILQPIGADPNLTELRAMLVAPEHEAAAVAALLAAQRTVGPAPDWIRVAGLRRDGDARRQLLARADAVADREISAFSLRLPDSWEEFKRTRPRNVRESLRKCYNSLARDGHEWRFRAIEGGPELDAALARFCELHAYRAQAGGSVAHPDYFAPAPSRAFLGDVMTRLGSRGAARVFQLEIGGEVVAARLGFRFGDELYLYYSGYDPAWGKYSVMTTVVAETMRHAIEQGITTVNLSTGADVSKTRWRPEELPFGDVVVVNAGARARFSHLAFTRAAAWKSARRRRALMTAAASPSQESND
ncbi:GNAT family N-acetyltransferase [Gemmatirosa kalamazoonensis]|nr:GNAT family N-acetyltransferase [Gemmatirosa kalamazoonensis]